MPDVPDSLEEVLTFLFDSGTPHDPVLKYLERINTRYVALLIRALDRADRAEAPKGRGTKKQFEGRRSAVKGKLYERLVGEILDGIRCFQSWNSVDSTTNEIDFLVVLSPSAKWVPAMATWGTHCICECKYHATHVSTDWVTKLNTVLQTHQSQVGILFSKKGIAKSGRGVQIRHQLQLLAAHTDARMIICLDWDDITAVVGGEPFLQMLTTRYIELQAGLQKLGLVAAGTSP